MVSEVYLFQAKLTSIVVSAENFRSSGFSEPGDSVGAGKLPLGAVL